MVEDHILHATQGLVTRAFTDELWNMALSKIIAVLRTHSVSSTNTNAQGGSVLEGEGTECEDLKTPSLLSLCYLHGPGQRDSFSLFVIES